MDVRCPQCETLYELDDTQLDARKTATLKCSQCSHVFRLEARRSISRENQRRWMIRKTETGDVLYLGTFDVLHQWIMERRVDKEDEISRTGNKWVTLGSIGEFMPVFQVVESISNIAGAGDADAGPEDSAIATRVPTTGERPAVGEPTEQRPPSDASSSDLSAAPAAAESARESEKPARERVRTSLQFGNSSSGVTPAPADQSREEATKRERPSVRTPMDLPPNPQQNEAADASGEPPGVNLDSEMFPSQEAEADDGWAIGDTGPNRTVASDTSGTHQIDRPPKSRGPWLVAAMFVVLAGGGAFLYLQNPDVLGEVVKPKKPEVVTIGDAEEKESRQNDSTAHLTAAVEPVGVAVNTAVAALREVETKKFTEARSAAAQPIAAAVDKADRKSRSGNVDVMLKNAKTALQNGNRDRARKLFHRVLEKDNDNSEAITGLGWTLLELGKPSAAAAQFRKALHHNPGYGDAYIGLGSAERQVGNLQKAYDAYDRYLGRHPKGPKASIASYQLKQLKKQLGK